MSNTQINVDGVTVDGSSVSKPSNRSFRDAWQLTGNVIDVDMTRARDIHRDNLRAARKAAMETLDYLQKTALIKGTAAVGNDEGDIVNLAAGGYTADQLEDQLQSFRDITDDQAIEDAATPEDLSSIWPLGLTAPE